MVKALALFSGGLDSTLSAKIILDQGAEVEAIYFANAFLPAQHKHRQASLDRKSYLTGQACQLGIKLHILDISRPHLEIVRNPRYGYGENMNPCIDCRILMLKEAKAYMQSHRFHFLISGEVLGQRPMSQRRDTLNIIDRDADVKGLILRPLSAKKLAPTLAEEKGWVDRNKLFDFSGRTRRPQLALAKKLGIKEYLTPAGGCLLTEAEFTRKFKDLMSSGKVGLEDVHLLKIGRHFRTNSFAKIIVGRDEEENRRLVDLAKNEDILFKLRDFTGPLTLARPIRNVNRIGLGISNGARPIRDFDSNGADTDGSKNLTNEEITELIETAAKLTARYSKGKDKELIWVDCWSGGLGKKKFIQVAPAGEDLIEKMRI